ncbi:hypothetical protein LHYA1_G004388 [Lachnellula hyalina]|uniref:BTB domain-containing protein n=1 Tax=Lachnellula hyalina TaxID=1316788 RepID=A0A8H8TYM1_9HELO|nr:uncharacterized protein LHYA1_G004388 [Lachnellula hyalina]TVY26787.1 hypothetical protein LHYA1_G004388 [Lachnellula hyalina]
MPDFTPDTRLRVFGRDFHVHSSFLKLHSAFFRTFLESPEKGLPVTSCGFRYEWVTEVDKDDTWSLIWAGSTEKSGTVSDVGKFTGDQNAEISAFTIPIAIALYPAYLSLFIVAFGSREFCDSIRGNEIKIRVAAIKLRNEVLYRAYMTLLMGPWTMPKYLCIKDKKLEQLAALVHHSIFCKVLRTQHNVSQGIVEFGGPHFARIYQREELEAMTS